MTRAVKRIFRWFPLPVTALAAVQQVVASNGHAALAWICAFCFATSSALCEVLNDLLREDAAFWKRQAARSGHALFETWRVRP